MVAYGGGVNTIALIELLRRRGERPDDIIMSDPGDEWPESHEYRVNVANPWLESIGFPQVTVVTRAHEAQFRPRAHKTVQGTLREECLRINAVPSIAYGYKKCSQKYKALPANWYIERQTWAQAEWARGAKIIRAIGYDAGETTRAVATFMEPLENRRFSPYYPLLNAGIDRDGCIDLIRAAGLPVPHKSACMYCPSNHLAEWKELHDVHPEHYARAVEMSQNAVGYIDAPDVVGLMRCNPHGKRQLHLHVWDGRVPEFDEEASREALPCECAL